MIKFSGYLLLFDVICLLTAGVPIYLFVGAHVFTALVISLVITSLLALLSFIPFMHVSGGTFNQYLAAILSGMLIRMFFIGLSIAIVFVFTELHQIGFTVGLLFSYICKTVIETIILTQKLRGHTSAQ